MRLALVLAVLVFLPAARARAAGEPLRLETPAKVDAVKLADVDGDGTADVVTLSGRTVCVWTAGKDALATAAPRWKVDVPSDVSFVDVARSSRPALLCVGSAGARLFRLDAASRGPGGSIPGSARLDWRDGSKAVFARLHPGPAGDPTFLVPSQEGWRLAGRPDAVVTAAEPLRIPPRREVTAAGPFLEDTATLKAALPSLQSWVFPAPPSQGATPAYLSWGVFDDALHCFGGPGPLAYDLSFLPATGDRTLVPMDADPAPDLIHRDGDNREGRYAFFRVPPPEPEVQADGTTTWKRPADLRPPAAFLRLSGFNLDPDYADVDGDGLVDFVVTTIAVDGQNTLRAVATGKVVATTLAFLQRKQAPGAPMFATQPDATVTSDIGVRIRFGFTGTIDVTRSFTILATGDLDGDGRKDLVIRSGPGTLQVRKGTAEGVWAKDAAAVGIPTLGAGEECEAHAANLDGKPGDDVLLHYRGADSAHDRLYVLAP
jgi:hypothetical protein